ncbi:MAG: leucine-rich repeat domain-containing protein [Saprospiraceae bacterium]
MTDQSTNNLSLVLELAAGLGHDAASLRGYVFGIAVFGADRHIRGRALGILGAISTEQTMLEARRLQESAQYHFDDAAYFSRWRNAELDPFDVLLAYKMCAWHRGTRPDATFAAIAHQSLNLSAYELPSLTPGIAAFHFVRYIWLPAHTGFDLEGSLAHLMPLPLESVYLENNKLPVFPVELLAMPQLQTLSIRRGKHRPRQPMQTPEGGPWDSTRLENLIIEGYPMAEDIQLGPFPNLREADIQRCRLHSMAFLDQSPLLERLRLRGNQLQSLPPFLSQLTHLREMDLTENPWQVIQLDLTGLSALQKFQVSK